MSPGFGCLLIDDVGDFAEVVLSISAFAATTSTLCGIVDAEAHIVVTRQSATTKKPL
jgi:hypothetical protein